MNSNQTSNLSQFPKIQTYSSIQDNSSSYFQTHLNNPKGISVLSQRMPIPLLSPLESCRGTPMKLINFSPSLSKGSQKTIRKLMANKKVNDFLISQDKLILDHHLCRESSLEKRDLNDAKKTRQSSEKKVELEPLKIHRYARPRLLRAMKRDGYEFEKRIEFSANVPLCRSGFVGKKKVSGSFLANVKQRSVSPSNFYLQLP